MRGECLAVFRSCPTWRAFCRSWYVSRPGHGKYYLPPSLCVLQLQTPTLKYLCVGCLHPSVLALCLKNNNNKLQSFFLCDWIPEPLSYGVYLLPAFLPLGLKKVCDVQSESADQRRRLQAEFRVGANLWLHDNWPVKEKTVRPTAPTAGGYRRTHSLLV